MVDQFAAADATSDYLDEGELVRRAEAMLPPENRNQVSIAFLDLALASGPTQRRERLSPAAAERPQRRAARHDSRAMIAIAGALKKIRERLLTSSLHRTLDLQHSCE